MAALLDDLALLIERGGYVMVLLLALSVVSLGLILERSAFWLWLHRRSRLHSLDRLNAALRAGDRTAAERLTRADRSPYFEVARRMLRESATDAVAVDAVQRHRPRLDRFMVALSTIITAAPLLGILGTVIGIIQSFKLLGVRPTLNDPTEVAGGIAEALLTTALGLIVALFTLFPYMIFRGQVDRALGRLESVIAAAQQGVGRDAAVVKAARAAAEPTPNDLAEAAGKG
jgi:biopolymer transport protein ExbB